MADLIPWAVGIGLLIATALGLYFAVQNPAFIYPIAKAIIKDIVLSMIPLVAPKDYTKEELAKIRAGQEPGKPGQKPQHDDFPRNIAKPANKPLTAPPKKPIFRTREK